MHAREGWVGLGATVANIDIVLIILIILYQILLIILWLNKLELINWWNSVSGSVEFGHGLYRFQALFVPFILVVPFGRIRKQYHGQNDAGKVHHAGQRQGPPPTSIQFHPEECQANVDCSFDYHLDGTGQILRFYGQKFLKVSVTRERSTRRGESIDKEECVEK